jgi:Flp pilus assembly protein TadG
MTIRKWLKAAPRNDGTTAVEFAIILPLFLGLTIGGLYLCSILFSFVGMQHAVDQAARCYAVEATQCGSASAASSYAQAQYNGVGTPLFSASTASCGFRVSASMTIGLPAVISNLSVPLTATACFP